ncbi:glycosyltransferase family 76 protein [Collybiopsis luxurians FD-317 M1]|nr:glycosyltransferase family 76 protein [Collybiopsis luxurians FD-317 M1]
MREATTTWAPRLLLFSLLSRALIYVLAYYASHLPLFDASPNLFASLEWSKPYLRWDVFHFAHIAEQGYVYEHEWAQFPGLPLLLGLFKDRDIFLLVGLIAIDCDTTNVLYRLSLQNFNSPNFALLVSLLSLLPSSPAALRLVPYTEPFFTYLSYRGMLYCAETKWFLATICFALASAFRSNGILLSGFILWGLLVRPFLETAKPPVQLSPYAKSIVYSAIIFIPFISHQATGYFAFCASRADANPSWCSQPLPLIYSHVQSTYWNVGFLRYWTMAQLPNFIISAPLFTLIFVYCAHVFCTATSSSVALVPHAIQACVLCCTLLFGSHVQIILRLAPSMPLMYWAVAWLVIDHPKAGKWWVGCSVVWGTIAILLWSVFLPPA